MCVHICVRVYIYTHFNGKELSMFIYRDKRASIREQAEGTETDRIN